LIRYEVTVFGIHSKMSNIDLIWHCHPVGILVFALTGNKTPIHSMNISFIIPAYNASSFLSRCIDSIYNLNLEETDFEVLVIDDCSTDNTAEILRCYAGCHQNLTLLRQSKNHRQGAARNRGVSIAKGTYITFVDSDDMIGQGVLTALETALRLNLDIAVMNHKFVSVDGETREKEYLQYDENRIFSGVEMQMNYPYWNSAPVAYLYKLSFLNQVNYPFAEDVFYEDSDFVNVHLYYAKRMAYCRKCGYQFFENLSSTTHSMTYINLADYFLLGTRMLNFYRTVKDSEPEYSSGILEGGSYNIWVAFRKIEKLSSRKEIELFYDRIDEYYDRKSLLSYREPGYCWTFWTRFCLKYKYYSIMIAWLKMIGRYLVPNRIVIKVNRT